MSVIEELLSEQELLVLDWRLERFLDLGFDCDDAELLAVGDVSWHVAESMIVRGCPPEVAVKILT